MKDIKSASIIGANSFFEYFNSKTLYFFAGFAFLMLYFSFVLGLMAVDEEKRILMDFGLAVAEIMGFAFSLFWSAQAIEKEMQNKTIYLILSRPVSRSVYVLGKFIGMLYISAFIFFSSCAIHACLFLLKGYTLTPNYLLVVFFSYLKIVLISAFAICASLITTSSFSAILISLMVWMFGHFSMEVKYLLDKTQGFSKILLSMFIYALPNFNMLNLRDIPADKIEFFLPFSYFSAYFLFLTLLSAIAFRKKEF